LNLSESIALTPRSAPYSQQAEESVLGSLLIDPEAYHKVEADLTEKDFYRAANQLIYRHIAKLHEKGLEVDIVTVGESLDDAGDLDMAGGMTYLAELASVVPSATHVATYATTVRQDSVSRALVEAGQRIADLGFHRGEMSVEDALNEAEAHVFSVSNEGQSNKGADGMSSLLSQAWEKLDMLDQSKGGLTGLSTGFKDIDLATSGLQRQNLVIVAGRPSMGKTAFMMNLAEAALLKGQGQVVVYSMEMPGDDLMIRMLSSLGRVDQGRARSGNLTEADWPKLTMAQKLLHGKPLHIDDSAGLTVGQIRARTRRLARKHGKIGLIVVDYLQLMHGHGNSRNEQISEISRNLKLLAKEFDCPVVAGSQLNRSLEQRTDKRPVMSDLRESGAIEQDADVIMALYRDSVYNPHVANPNLAEVLILKQRNGPIGRQLLSFNGPYTRFEDVVEPVLRETYSAWSEEG